MKKHWLPFKDYLGFCPATEDWPENWYAPVTIFFAYRLIGEKQIELPLFEMRDDTRRGQNEKQIN